MLSGWSILGTVGPPNQSLAPRLDQCAGILARHSGTTVLTYRETVIGQSTVDHDDPLVRAGGHSDMGTLRDLFHIV